MEKVPDALVFIDIDKEFVCEWLDSFHPSTKTLATHLVVNLIPRYGCDYLIENGYDEILSLMCDHFYAFLQVRVAKTSPENILSGFLPGQRDLLD